MARAKRLRRTLRSCVDAASRTCFAAADRLGPDARAGRVLNRAGATIGSRGRRLEHTLRGDGSWDAAQEHEQIVRARWRRRREVREPLVLIGQVHRSGGTLLARLFDGHPELHTLPHELGPLLPRREVPTEAGAAWRTLADPKLPRRFARGLRQAGKELNRDEDIHSMLLPPLVHRRLFERALEQGASTPRAVVDAYLGAYFNAWLDYRGLEGEKRWVVGFEPGALVDRERMRRFDELYPDGRVIALLRDPWSWFVSARRWDPRYAQLGPALDAWAASAGAGLERQQSLPEQAKVVLFDDLVLRTEATMRSLAAWLGIRYDDVLARPTLNGIPVAANSSFPAAGEAVSAEPATVRRALLSAEEEQLVAERAGSLYEQVAASVRADERQVA